MKTAREVIARQLDADDVLPALIPEMTENLLTALSAAGWRVVPVEPTPEMIAKTLPLTGRHHDPLAERTAKAALFILENQKPSKYDIPIEEHHKGYGAALDLIGDWRSMLAASPKD